MKKLLILLLALLAGQPAWADASCARPTETALYLDSSSTADIDGASHALLALRASLGDSAQGRSVSYGLAYGHPDGIVPDLVQAAERAGASWDSQIMGWVAGLAGAPDWFGTWYAAFLTKAGALPAPDVQAQAAAYARSIDFGRTVLVVAHSSANVDVNAASRALAAQRGAAASQGFGIFAVATTAADVGGSASPYLTNDRDIVQVVAGALPANLVLHHSDGSLATDIARIDADRLETYLSGDYDAQAVLLQGIQQRLAALTAPTPACGQFDYRKQFVSLVAGSYTGSCDGTPTPRIASVGADGLIALPADATDISEPHMSFALYRRFFNDAGAVADARGIALRGLSTSSGGASTGVDWDGTQAFQHASVNLASCDATGTTPQTSIASPVDIAVKASALMGDLRDTFAPGDCVTMDAASGAVAALARQPVWIAGSTLNIGTAAFDLTAQRVSDEVLVDSIDNTDGEPQFAFQSQLSDGTSLNFKYKLFSGLTEFSTLSATGIDLNCKRN